MNSAWKSYGCIFVAGCLWGTNGLFVKLMQGSRVYIGVYRICADCIEPADIDGDHISERGTEKPFKISKNTLISCALLGLVARRCTIMYTVPQSTVWAYLLHVS